MLSRNYGRIIGAQMPKQIGEQDIAAILEVVKRHPGGARREDIAKGLPQEAAAAHTAIPSEELWSKLAVLCRQAKAGRRSTFCRRRRPHLEPPL